MDQISRFVVWICSRFNREQIEKIIKELADILKSRQEFPSKPKNAFKQQHPNYREFTVDPTPPLTDLPDAKKKPKI
jgi:plasmid stabilization system protein ParE